MTNKEITRFLEKEMTPALGCTGPTAYALAAACCGAYLEGELRELKLSISPGFLKIGYGVATPGTSQPGIEIAAALGYVGGDWKRGLQVLEPCTPADVAEAQKLVDGGLVRVLCDWEQDGLYVRAEVTAERGQALAVVERTHDGVSRIEVNGETVFRGIQADGGEEEADPTLLLEDVFRYVRTVPAEELAFLMDGYRMNLELAEEGLKHGFGLRSGLAHLRRSFPAGKLPPDLRERPLEYLPENIQDRIRILVSAASDARMGGSRMPAMTAMGDGNQGITAMLPVGAAAECLGASEEETLRALALSCLMLFFVKLHIGRVGSFCMCAIGASSGAAAGLGLLYGLGEKQIRAAVKTVISPLAGMLCDGAKNGCALKMATAADSAFLAVELAKEGVEPGFYDGVCDETLEDTVAAVSCVAVDSKELLDRCLVENFVKKAAQRSGERT